MIKALYVHIPFCKKICSYCNFVKRVSNKEYINKYIDKICDDLKQSFSYFHLEKEKIETIYFGGGTPSSIGSTNLKKILTYFETYFKNNNLKEVTIEINPEDLNKELIDILSASFINRVSIGIQTFDIDLLKIMNRTTCYNSLKDNIIYLQKKGITNINFDLMYAVKEIPFSDIKKDLDLFFSLNPTHISTYSLELNEKTVLYNMYKKGLYQKVSEEYENETYYKIVDYLALNGFYQYETSNFSRFGFESIHNLTYWHNEEYLAIGLGASSYINNKRFNNEDKLINYLNQKYEDNIFKNLEIIDKKLELEYEIILNLRLIKGINLKKIKDIYHCDLLQSKKIKQLINDNYLILDNQFLKINPQYFYIQNYFISLISLEGDSLCNI